LETFIRQVLKPEKGHNSALHPEEFQISPDGWRWGWRLVGGGGDINLKKLVRSLDAGW